MKQKKISISSDKMCGQIVELNLLTFLTFIYIYGKLATHEILYMW